MTQNTFFVRKIIKIEQKKFIEAFSMSYFNVKKYAKLKHDFLHRDPPPPFPPPARET